MRYADELGVEELVLYAMSLDNLKNRDPVQRDFLLKCFTLLAERLSSQETCFQVQFAGQLHLLPEKLQNLIKEIESRNNPCQKKLTICIAYSGIEEMRQAALQAKDCAAANDQEMFEKFVEVCEAKISQVDLLVRTGFHYRISDFMCWQVICKFCLI